MALVPPGYRALRGYRRRWLVKDLVAGVVLTTLLVPQGMAYAELAGLPPITGLYTTIMCLLAYAVFGPSRILVLGPDSSLGPMIAATVLPLVAAGGDPGRAVALASMLALMTAAVMIAAGALGLGFVADLLSKPTMIGYMNGLALSILVGQLPKLFGFSVDGEGLIGEFVGFVQGVAQGDAVPAAAAVGLGGIVVILVLQRWWANVPAVLVMVVLAIVVSTVFRLGEEGVSLIGVLPKGFPPLTLPSVGWSDVGPLAGGALAIALVSLADTISTSSSFAGRTGQEVHGNQEMIGIGAANLTAGLFQGFPVSTSASRTAVAERAGAKSQLTGVTGAALIIVMIVFLPGLFKDLPQAALAAVVITAALSLADLPGHRPALAPTEGRVQPVHRRVPRRRAARRATRDRDRGRPVHPQRLPPGVAAVPDDAGAGRRRCGVPRRPVLPGRSAAAGAGALPLRCAPVLRQRQDVPRRDHDARTQRSGPAVDRRRGRADHRRGHHGRRRPLRPGSPARRARPDPGLRRAQGSGAKQDRPVRAHSRDRAGAFLSHGRGRHRRLVCQDRCNLDCPESPTLPRVRPPFRSRGPPRLARRRSTRAVAVPPDVSCRCSSAGRRDPRSALSTWTDTIPRIRRRSPHRLAAVLAGRYPTGGLRPNVVGQHRACPQGRRVRRFPHEQVGNPAAVGSRRRASCTRPGALIARSTDSVVAGSSGHRPTSAAGCAAPHEHRAEIRAGAA